MLLTALHESFAGILGRWYDAGGDAVEAGLADDYAHLCGTLGRPVRVDLVGGGVLEGRATGIDGDGALLVDDGSSTHRVVAGDVHHLRLSA
ncbi:hypothetical protein [Paraoerskovia sediminicola]|uniref:hypothetical protein n=1 Tax=Paraoerskovia sediminicola TaxID=1138587 RepID=UPI0025732132|nr:hypothetical protein [Paraoerskovia sediminicola]